MTSQDRSTGTTFDGLERLKENRLLIMNTIEKSENAKKCQINHNTPLLL